MSSLFLRKDTYIESTSSFAKSNQYTGLKIALLSGKVKIIKLFAGGLEHELRRLKPDPLNLSVNTGVGSN